MRGGGRAGARFQLTPRVGDGTYRLEYPGIAVGVRAHAAAVNKHAVAVQYGCVVEARPIQYTILRALLLEDVEPAARRGGVWGSGVLHGEERRREWSGARGVRSGRWESWVMWRLTSCAPAAAYEEEVVGSAARDRTGCLIGRAPAPAVEHVKQQLVQGVGRFGVPPRLT